MGFQVGKRYKVTVTLPPRYSGLEEEIYLNPQANNETGKILITPPRGNTILYWKTHTLPENSTVTVKISRIKGESYQARLISRAPKRPLHEMIDEYKRRPGINSFLSVDDAAQKLFGNNKPQTREVEELEQIINPLVYQK